MDVLKLREDLLRKATQVRRLNAKIPGYVAGAAEKMKDANFSAEGFVQNSSANPRWPKRKKETKKTSGKKILHGTGYMQNNVKAKAMADRVSVGVDLSKVPYAQVHNEGGELQQRVKTHTRKHHKTGKRMVVKSHSRRIVMPERRYLGYVPDIEKITDKEVKFEMDRIFKH